MRTKEEVEKAEYLLFCTAFLAVVWTLIRAHIQSVTIDEADTYLAFVSSCDPLHWYPASNNHILNSMLARLSTGAFGLSHLTLRLPAFLGAIIYIGSCLWICRNLAIPALSQWVLLVCLVWSPFVGDYLVAARGYSLALGFLACSSTLLIGIQRNRFLRNRQRLGAMLAWISVCLALSFAANFSFAFVLAGVFLLACFEARAWIKTEEECGWRTLMFSSMRLAGALILPAAVIFVFLSSSAVLSWPPGQLWYGAHSLNETIESVRNSLLFEPNPNLVNPLLLPYFKPAGSFLLGFLGWAVALRAVVLLSSTDGFREARVRQGLAIAGGSLFVLCLAMAGHYVAFRTSGLPLPLERTALYVVPLVALICGSVAGIPAGSVIDRILRGVLVTTLLGISTYFVCCTRLSYFKEWQYDADVERAYFALAYLDSRKPLNAIESHWRYRAPLNYYRKQFPTPRLPAVPSDAARQGTYPHGADAYICHYPDDAAFIEKEGLKIVFRGELSHLVIAVPPDRAE